ncbi:MAG: hypothetical protein Kow00109_15600 [Acidobacteriota bacterium]
MSEKATSVRTPELLWLTGAVSAILASLCVAWAATLPAGGLALSSAVGLAVACAALWADALDCRKALIATWLVMGTIGAACFLLYWYLYWGHSHYFLTQVLGYILGGSLGLIFWSLRRLHRREA